MSLVIRIAPTAPGGWTIASRDDAPAAPPLPERQLAAGSQVAYPVRPRDDGTGVAIHGDVEKLGLGTLDGAGAAKLGEYLHQVLFGDGAPPKDARIAIEIADDRPLLHALPWELAIGPGQTPLVSLAGALLRRQVVDPPVARKAVEIDWPPRVLFVVGSDPNDSRIRPGAEYLGVVRQVDELRTHLVMNATDDSLVAAMRAFRPNVVHFICHGALDPVNGPYLELVGERGQTVQRYGKDLAALLTVDEKLPAVVILNACYSGGSSAFQTAPPLAAQLVGGGVALAVGMSGAISDTTCRIFARRLYGALAREGSGLVDSCARARRHVMQIGAATGHEWALISMFIRHDVDDVVSKDGEKAAAWFQSARNHHQRPPFLGRWRFQRQVDLLLLPPTVQQAAAELEKMELRVLGLMSDVATAPTKRFGLTWALRNLRARAAREGHLVAHVDLAAPAVRQTLEQSLPAGADRDWFRLGRLCAHLWDALASAVDLFGVAWVSKTFGPDMDAGLEAAIATRPANQPLHKWADWLLADLGAAFTGLSAASYARDAACVVFVLDNVQAVGTIQTQLLDVLDRVSKRTQAGRLRIALGYKTQAGSNDLASEFRDWTKKTSYTRGLSLSDFEPAELDLVHRQHLWTYRRDDEPFRALLPVDDQPIPALVELVSSPGDFEVEVHKYVSMLLRTKRLTPVEDEALLKAIVGQ